MSKRDEATANTLLAAIAGILALFVVLNLVSYIWFPFLPWFEQRDAGEEIVRDKMDAEEAIQNYEWFRMQWRDIQAQRATVQNHKAELQRFYGVHGTDPNDWSREARERHARIQTRITGSQNQLERMIAEYNARSDTAYRGMFKCSLPYRVDERFQVTGPPGSTPAGTPTDKYVNGTSAEGEAPPPSDCDGLPEYVRRTAASS